MRLTAPVTALLLTAVIAAPSAAQSVDIREWPVPWEDTRPRDPYVDGNGQVWFVGQRGNYIGVLRPESGEFRRYELSERALPHNLIVDDDGIVWYAGNGNAHIGRLDPATGEVREIRMPDAAARDPHTLIFDGNGDIWFTVQGGNFVGKLDTDSHEVRLVSMESERARPYGIVVDDSGRPWFNLFGTNRLATVDPQTFQLREIPLAREGARTRRIDMTSDGMLWYVDYAEGFLGRFDPVSEQVEEWAMPGGTGSRPYAMAVDGRDRIWIVESGTQPNRFVGFDPATETFFGVTDVPSGGGTVRHMVFHQPSNTIWFGADTGTIGRIVVP